MIYVIQSTPTMCKIRWNVDYHTVLSSIRFIPIKLMSKKEGTDVMECESSKLSQLECYCLSITNEKSPGVDWLTFDDKQSHLKYLEIYSPNLDEIELEKTIFRIPLDSLLHSE